MTSRAEYSASTSWQPYTIRGSLKSFQSRQKKPRLGSPWISPNNFYEFGSVGQKSAQSSSVHLCASSRRWCVTPPIFQNSRKIHFTQSGSSLRVKGSYTSSWEKAMRILLSWRFTLGGVSCSSAYCAIFGLCFQIRWLILSAAIASTSTRIRMERQPPTFVETLVDPLILKAGTGLPNMSKSSIMWCVQKPRLFFDAFVWFSLTIYAFDLF